MGKIETMCLGLEGRKHPVLERAYLENHSDGSCSPTSPVYVCVILIHFL